MENYLKEVDFGCYFSVESHIAGEVDIPVGSVARGKEWTQSPLFPGHRWPNYTSCCSEKELNLPQVCSGPSGIPVKDALRKNLSKPSWEPWLFGTVGHARRDTLQLFHSAAQTPAPGLRSRQKTAFKHQLFIPFCCPSPLNFFFSDETFQQTPHPHPHQTTQT